MKQQLKRLTAISLSIFLLLSMITVFSNSQSYGATQYVTLDGNPYTLNGAVTVYKDSGCNTPWTFTSSSGTSMTAILGKNTYMAYKKSVGTYCYEVEFGDLKGYVLQSKTKLSSLPSSAVNLSNRKKVTVGVWGNLYVPYKTKVVYTNQSQGKVAWANYCNDPLDSDSVDAWVYSPYAFAYFKALS